MPDTLPAGFEHADQQTAAPPWMLRQALEEIRTIAAQNDLQRILAIAERVLR